MKTKLLEKSGRVISIHLVVVIYFVDLIPLAKEICCEPFTEVIYYYMMNGPWILNRVVDVYVLHDCTSVFSILKFSDAFAQNEMIPRHRIYKKEEKLQSQRTFTVTHEMRLSL